MFVYLNVLYLFCALIMASFGVAIFRTNRLSAAGHYLFLFVLGSIFWMVSLYLGYFFAAYSVDLSLLFIRFAFAFPCLWYFCLTAFLYHFPQKTFSFPRRLELLFGGIAVLFFSFAAFTPLVEQEVIITDEVLVGDVFGRFYLPYSFYFLGHLAIGLAIGLYKLYHLHGIARKKLMLAMFGFWIFLFLAVMTNVILPLFGILILQQEAIVFSLFFLIPAFYAMQKYRFLNLPNATLNLERQFFIFASSCLVVIGSNEMLKIFAPQFLSFVSALIIFTFGLLTYIGLQKFFPRFVAAELRAFRETFQEFKAKLYTCESYAELQKLFDELFEIRLNISGARVFLLKKSQELSDVLTYSSSSFIKILTILEKTQKEKVFLLEEIETNQNLTQTQYKIVTDFFRQLEATVCCPLFFQGHCFGFFILGEKGGGISYVLEEIQELSAIREELAIAVMNIFIRNNLAEELDVLKSIIAEKTRDLKQMVQQQADFMAVAAHELRTPLSISLFKLQELLSERKEYAITAELFAEMQLVESALLNLKSLTQQLFEVQQYELGKVYLNLQPILFAEFFERLTQDFEGLMTQKTLQLEVTISIPHQLSLAVDPEKLRQLFTNLVSNAIKFTPEHGKIMLRVLEEKNMIRIEVEDTGKGIPEKEKMRIFEKFQTLNPHMNMGLGLGLYLCKNIVELHHGKIWVEDGSRGGARFCIALPKPSPNKIASKPKKLSSA